MSRRGEPGGQWGCRAGGSARGGNGERRQVVADAERRLGPAAAAAAATPYPTLFQPSLRPTPGMATMDRRPAFCWGRGGRHCALKLRIQGRPQPGTPPGPHH